MTSTLDKEVAEGPGGGHLADNVVQFCRTLRRAGLPIGPGQSLAALEAVETVNLGTREDLYWSLHAALITRHDQRELFDQAFHMFWRRPDFLKRAMGLFMPTIDGADPKEPEKKEVARRLQDALRQEGGFEGHRQRDQDKPPEIEFDAAFTVSDRERLRTIDFEQMTGAELEEVKRAIARLRLPVPQVRTRRFQPSPMGEALDLRQTLRRSARNGGDTLDLARKRNRKRPAPLVVLCDVSGSMSRYSRMVLHLLHAIHRDGDRVSSFLFGTRLTNISRALKDRDVDVALANVAELVPDWSGGTRIGEALRTFNRVWSRRVLAQGAVVLFISDGLERDDTQLLSQEAERLGKSCRRFIPLLRFDGYQPHAKGARALMPHIDEFRASHNLASLTDLVAALDADSPLRDGGIRYWRQLAAGS